MSTTITPTTAASSLLNTLSGTPATTTVGPQANDPQMNEFLQLLTAQLQNQDPTSPTDPTQFVSQLAQFSTVEQLVQSNTKLDTISQTLSGLALGQYSGLINHTVSAAATSITVPTSGTQSQMAFNVTAANLSGVHVQITDASGNPVRSIPVSGSTGAVAFDGLSDSGQPLPAGQYGVSLVGMTSQGTSQSAGTLTTTGTVSGVLQGSNGGWLLQFNDGRTVDASTVTTVS
ncbi:MAG TPA: flagellar hook capping FlgD N-terminal domain-containing protein [Acetobacteraceae bacterium]|jgi:flagellar basal-body rod modification protein FlgD|nr:flagellar hook capping FlgD N-terminal domain-containing protein [Acetobacteraceae bacterium]